jgi:hypothetical protein
MSQKCNSAAEIAASPEVQEQYAKLPKPYSNIPLETLLTEPSTFRLAIENLVAGGLRRDKMTQHMEHVVVAEGALKHIEKKPYSSSELAQYLSQEAGQKDVDILSIFRRAVHFASLPQDDRQAIHDAHFPHELLQILKRHGPDGALGLIAHHALDDDSLGIKEGLLEAMRGSSPLKCNTSDAREFIEQCHHFVHGSKVMVRDIEKSFEKPVARFLPQDATAFAAGLNQHLDEDRQLKKEFKHPERIHLLVQRLAQERFVFLSKSPYAMFDDEGKPDIRDGKAWMRAVESTK